MSQASPSGPCSACTTRSIAANSTGTVSSAITTTSEGPANEAGIPTAPRTSRLASDTQRLPAPDDDVHAGDGLGAVGHGGDGLRSSDAVDLLDPRHTGGREHLGWNGAVPRRRHAQRDP